MKQGTSGTHPKHENFQKPNMKDSKKVTKSNDKGKTLCKFYKNGRCKKDHNCNFLHPKICRKFNQFGNKQDNAKGCDEKCGFFHPNACRSSLKYRNCSYKECRFYHLSGTKFIQKSNDNYQRKFPSKSNTQLSHAQPIVEENKEKFVSKNRFEVLEEVVEDEITEVKQVFHKGQTKITDTLAAIMARLTNIL